MKYKRFRTLKLLGSITLVSVLSLGLATTVNAKMVKPNTPVKAQIKKTSQPITIGNNKLIALDNTLLMTNNTKILYETTLINNNLEKRFDLNNQDGQYLGVIIENYNNKYLPVTITGDEYINKKGILDHKLQLNVPLTLSNPNDLYALHIFTEIPEESMHYKIEVGNEDYICRNVEVKIVLFNDPSDLTTTI